MLAIKFFFFKLKQRIFENKLIYIHVENFKNLITAIAKETCIYIFYNI